MADERMTLSGINWRETFAFTHLFRSFRLAIHPSKLILGLMLLLSLYLGGRLLDRIWPNSHLAVDGEVEAYATLAGKPHAMEQLREQRESVRRAAANRYLDLLVQYRVFESRSEEASNAAREGKRFGELKDKIDDALDNRIKEARAARDKALEAANEREGDDKAKARATAEANYRDTVREAYATANRHLADASRIHGRGIFITLFDYEVKQVDALVGNVLDWNWGAGNGVLGNIYHFIVTGPSWLLMAHPVYFFIFLVFFLIVWGLFGGAIARIAAVHAARDEKISIRAALKFSGGKLLSFVFAPIIPLLIIVGIGFLVFLGALVGNIPFIGPILIGLTFFLALAAGIVMTLVLLGLIGGFNLMYPTIAVEGSDSFDAISRSFSYLYARPWKMAFYTAVALVYGALTYLFVRFFIFLTLLLTHRFVNCGLFKTAYNGNESWLEMWPTPTWDNLPYDFNTLALGPGETTGAWLVAFWVYLLIGMLGAFAISFYFSANTIIYYLIRREVDATEMDDVYVEQFDEEFTETPPAPGPQATPPAAPASGDASTASATADTPTTSGAAPSSSTGTVTPPPVEPPAAPSASAPPDAPAPDAPAPDAPPASDASAATEPPPAEGDQARADQPKEDQSNPPQS